MTNSGAAPIIVGIDGSASAERAARWAAREAKARRVPLTLLHAYVEEVPVGGERALGERYRDVFIDYARDSLQRAADLARSQVAEVEVRTELVAGRPQDLLCARSAEASLVVLGSRGLGGVAGLLLGSVAVGVVSHARCPVVVVRGDEESAAGGAGGEGVAPVVVGLDGSPVSEAALAFALESASASGSPLVAVHAWRLGPEDTRLVPYIDLQAVAEEEERLLAEQLAGWGEKYPDVPIRRVLAEDRPARALLAESAGARLLVVGARGRGNAAGLLLGSTSQALIHRGPCPVAILRTNFDQD